MSTFADEAARLVLGERNESYGTPAKDYAKTATMWTGFLTHKLREPITPKEAVLMMALLKISREAHAHKPDNLIDAHGYLMCAEWIETGERPQPDAQLHMDTIEAVCTGERMRCMVCGQNKPCNCDHTENDE